MANEKIVGIKLVVDVAETKKLDDATTKLGLSIQKVASMSSSSVEQFADKAIQVIRKEEQTLSELAKQYKLVSAEIDTYKRKSTSPTTVNNLVAETTSLTNLAKLYQERTKLIEEANTKGSKGAAQQAAEITSLTASINKLTSSYDALIKKTQTFKDANLNIGPGGKDAAYIPAVKSNPATTYNYGTGATTPSPIVKEIALLKELTSELQKAEKERLTIFTASRAEELRLQAQTQELNKSIRQHGYNDIRTLELQQAQDIVNIRKIEAEKLAAIEAKLQADVIAGINKTNSYYDSQRKAVQNTATRQIDRAQQPVEDYKQHEELQARLLQTERNFADNEAAIRANSMLRLQQDIIRRSQLRQEEFKLVESTLQATRNREQAALEVQTQFEETIATRRLQTERNFADNEEAIRANELTRLRQDIQNRNATMQADLARRSQLRQEEIRLNNQVVELANSTRRFGANSLETLELQTAQNIVNIRQREAQQLQAIEDRILADVQSGISRSAAFYNAQRNTVQNSATRRVEAAQQPVTNRQAELANTRNFITVEETLINQSMARQIAAARYGQSSIEVIRLDSAHRQEAIERNLQTQLASIQTAQRAGTISQAQAQGQASQAFRTYQQDVLNSNSALREAESRQVNFQRTLGGTISRIFELTGAWRLAIAAQNAVIQGLQSIPQTLIAFQQLEVSVNAIFGSSIGARNIEFINKLAESAGQSVNTLREAYQRFAPAAALAGAEQFDINKVFQQFTETSTVLHLSEQQVKSLYLALEQMYGKANVQSEEMKKQLGNVLPGAVEIGAKAWAKYTDSADKSVRGFMKAMKDNQVFAAEFIPKFAESYRLIFGGENDAVFQDASTKLLSNLQRLKNQYTNVALDIGHESEGLMNSVVRGVGSGFKAIHDNFQGIEQGLVVIGASLLPAITRATLSWALATKTVGTVVTTNIAALGARFAAIGAATFNPVTLGLIGLTAAAYEASKATTAFTLEYGKFNNIIKDDTILKETMKTYGEMKKGTEEQTAAWNKAADTLAFLKKRQDESNSAFITYEGTQIRLGTIFDVVWNKIKTTVALGTASILTTLIEWKDKLTSNFTNPIDEVLKQFAIRFFATTETFSEAMRNNFILPDGVINTFKAKVAEVTATWEGMYTTNVAPTKSPFMEELVQAEKDAKAAAVAANISYSSILEEGNAEQAKVDEQKKQNAEKTANDLQTIEDNFWKSEFKKVEDGNKSVLAANAKANAEIDQMLEERKLAYEQAHLGDSTDYNKDAEDYKNYIEEIKVLQAQKLNNTIESLNWEKQALQNFAKELPQNGGVGDFYKRLKEEEAIAKRFKQTKDYFASQGEDVTKVPATPYADDTAGINSTFGKMPALMAERLKKLKEEEAQYKSNNKQLDLQSTITQQLETLETKLQETTVDRVKTENEYLKDQIKLRKDIVALGMAELANPYKTPNFTSTTQVQKVVDNKYYSALNTAAQGVQGKVPGATTLLNNLELSKQNDLWTENVKSEAAYQKKLDDIKNSTLNMNQVSTTVLGALGGKYQKVLAVLKDYDTGLKQIKAAQADNVQNTKIEQNVKIDPTDTDALTKHNQLLKAYSAQAIELDNKETASKLGNMSLLAGSISQFFGKKTALAKTANAIEVSLGVASMAMDKKSQLSALMTIPTKLAAGAAEMFSQSGWFGFAGVAAMIALMAGLGFSGIGGGSGGGGVPSIPESTGKGTVLGDSSKDSTALADSLQLLTDVGYKSYGELVKLNNNFTSIKNAIGSIVLQQAKGTLLQGTELPGYSGVSTSAKLAQHLPAAILLGPAFAAIGFALQQAIEKIPVIGKLLKGINDFILGGLFGKTTIKVTAQGILTNVTNVSKVLEGFNVGIQEFQTVEKKTKSWFSSSTKIYDVLSTASKAASSTFNTLFSSIASTMKQLAESVNPQAVVQLYSAKFNAIKINLKGLSAEKAGEKITKVFNAEMDKLATTVFKGIYDDLQQVGEGMFTTINRINIQREVLTPQLKKLNVTLPTDTVAATKFIDTLISFSSTADTASARLTETRDKLIAFYNATTPDSSKNLGAVDNLGAGLSTFFLTVASDAKKAVLTAQENYSDSVAALQAASTPAGRKKLGKKANSTIEILSTIADTRKQELATAESAISGTQTLYNSFFAKFKATGDFGSALKSMLTSINMNTAAGKQEAQILLNLAEATNNYNSILANTKKSIQDNIDTISATIEPVTSLSDLMATLSNTTDINKQQTLVTKIQKQIMDGYNTQINSINSLKSTFSNLINYVKGLVLGQYSVLNPKEQLAEAKKQFEELAATAKDATDPTKQQAAIDKLQGASDTYLGIAKKYYSSTVDFVTIQKSVLATLNDVISLSGTNSEDATANAILATKSVAELAISQLTTLSTTLTDAAIKAMQESVKNNVIDQGGTVTDTGVDANGTPTATVTPSGGTTAATTTASTLDSLFATLYGAKASSSLAKNTERQIKAYKHGGDTELQAEIQREEVKAHLAVLNKNKKLYKTEIADANALLKKLNSQISFKATGGFGQGLTMVGERGFELVDLPVGSKVHSNTQSQSIMKQDTAETVDQLKQIVLQLTELNGRMDKIDRKTTLSPKARA